MYEFKLEPQDVVYMYTVCHLSMEQIGRFFGVTRQAIFKHLKKAGIQSHHGEKANVVCIMCGKDCVVYRSKLKRQHNFYCSKECYLMNRSNPDYIPWRQGGRLARMIVKQYFPLKDEHIVHHIDSNQRNNKVENLMVFANHADHMKHHHGINKVVPLWDGSKALR